MPTAWPTQYNWPSGTSWPSGYNWQTDTQLIGRWEPGSLADRANGPFGALVSTGGVVTTTPAAIDGNPAWSLTAGGGIRLVSTNQVLTTPFFGPYTVVIVVRTTAGAGGRLFDPGSSFGTGLGTGTAQMAMQDGSNFILPWVDGAFQAITWYGHGLGSRAAANNNAFTTFAGNVNGSITGVTLGANRDGSTPGTFDIAGVYIFEGQLNPALSAGFGSYLRAKFPSVFSSAVLQAPFSVDQSSRGALPGGAFDIILATGQSNNANYSTGGNCASPGANTYLFDHDNSITAMKLAYDAGGTGYLDTIVRSGVQLTGGNGTSLCNAYAASTGRPVLFIPCAVGGSQLYNYGTPNYNTWDPFFQRGGNFRDSLFWSAVARLRNAIALGGTFRFIWHYQGESEAQLGLAGAISSFAANTNTILSRICTEAGVSRRLVVQTLSDTVSGASAPNIAAVQAQQASLASAGNVLVMAKNNNVGVDGLHLNNTGCDQVGAAVASAALAQTPGTGWY